MAAFDLKHLSFLGLFSIMFSVACFQPAAVASRNGFYSFLDEDYVPPHSNPPSPDYGPAFSHFDLEGSTHHEDYTPSQTHPPSPDIGLNGLTDDQEDCTPLETYCPSPDFGLEVLTVDDHEDYTPPHTQPPSESGCSSILCKPRNTHIAPSGLPAPGIAIRG